MNDFTQHRTNNLFLLVGSNPLPNYVAAKLLTDDQTKLYLVHTTETEGKIQQLENSLGRPGPSERIKVDNADAEDIFSRVKKCAEQCRGNIGLNYTGGTKAMAVHTYRAIQEVTKGETIASYLDSKTLQLLIDRKGQRSIPYPVQLEVKLSIQELLELHGYKLNKSLTLKPFQPNFCREMVNIPAENQKSWRGQNMPLLDLNDPAFDAIKKYWKDCNTLNDLAQKWGWREKHKEFLEFLRGKWLEHYALWSVQQIGNEVNITSSALSVEAINKHKDFNRKFEIDVVAMRGYQMFALYCSVKSHKPEIKQDLFEAYVRARQIGGDEAKIAAVCYAPKNDHDHNPLQIQTELEESWEEAKGRIRVFGAEHLPRLPEYLKQWFKG